MRYLALILVCVVHAPALGQSKVGVRHYVLPDGKSVVFEIVGLSDQALKAIREKNPALDQWQEMLSVHAVQAGREKGPPMLGSYRVTKDALQFESKFPVVPSVKYRVLFSLNEPQPLKIDTVVEFPSPASAPAVVERIYPSSDVLPENQLRFYIHFSAPMRQGDVYRHIRLLNADGRPIEQALLELEDELWDRDGKRFTLLLHPGRVKKGLDPRERLGPILESGKTYTLEIDRGWQDTNGNKLKASFQKRFRAGPPEEARVNPKTWKINSPPPQSKQPVVVQFPKPLDHALLKRLIWVVDADGKKTEGDVTIDSDESRWLFTPRQNWAEGAYRVVVDTRLEDRAGNSIARPFEVDVFHPVDSEIKQETIFFPFQVTNVKPPN